MAPDLIDDPDDAQGRSPESLLQFLSHHTQGSQRRRERNHRLGKRRRTITLLLGVALACALVAINVAIWGNFTHIRFVSHTPAATTSHGSHVATTKHRSQTHSTPSHPGGGTEPQTKKPKPSPPKLVRVRLTAVRNDSWVQVRKGSSTGPVLFAGVVRSGQSISAAGRGRLWARFGSLGNFDLTINGRPVRPTFNGTVDTVITATAIKPASTPTG